MTDQRLNGSAEQKKLWRKWGPYVSERSWGTVRENDTTSADAWTAFPFDHARSRAYRWTEDGIAGFCDQAQTLCLGLALWNGKDPILKERFFGLDNHQGNHGEDVKEYYYYLDGTPTHSYMKMLYKYPHVAFPYEQLVNENTRRDPDQPEFELIDALRDDLEQGRYFDVLIEYAHTSEEDILYRITAINRGSEAAQIHLLPQLWYRNTWAWSQDAEKPELKLTEDGRTISTRDAVLGERWAYMTSADSDPRYLFTDNETNLERVFGRPNTASYRKDGIDEAIVGGKENAVNPAQRGTKCAGHFQTMLAPNQAFTVQVRLLDRRLTDPFADFDATIAQRISEADEFYSAIQRPNLTDDERSIQRQGFAGLLWTQQFYYFDVDQWMNGRAESDRGKALKGWEHLHAEDIVSIPAKWEYPWFAAWDLCFQAMTLAYIDPEASHQQLCMLLKDTYMKEDGQIPAHEASFDDANPPLHAWGAWRLYQIEKFANGTDNTDLLERLFPELERNFDWWLKHKDTNQDRVFTGGFLGLDNIAPFDRTNPPLLEGAWLDQADATGWMALFALDMVAISIELAQIHSKYEAHALEYLDHFLKIGKAFFTPAPDGISLWDEADGFFYDVIRIPNQASIPIRVRSFVGLVPFLATLSIEPDQLEALPRLSARLSELRDQPEIAGHGLIQMQDGASIGLVVLNPERLSRIIDRLLSSQQFLSEYGIRSVSIAHKAHPFSVELNGETHTLKYEPGEANSGMMGGNSNWRGPIWAPINRLLIEALHGYEQIYKGMTVSYPSGSDQRQSLSAVADMICERLIRLMLRDKAGNRPHFGDEPLFNNDPHWRDYVMFYEFFNADTGAGLGATRQNGWTALTAELIQNGGRLAKQTVP